MDLKDIQNLIKFVSKSGVKEVDLEYDNVKIRIANGTDQQLYVQPMHAQTLPHASQMMNLEDTAPLEDKVYQEETNYITIKSPMIGTFYRKPGPDKELFVKVGDQISSGDVVCIIEAMKLFNEIESELSGKIVKILVEDSTPVEYDQPLFIIDPA